MHLCLGSTPSFSCETWFIKEAKKQRVKTTYLYVKTTEPDPAVTALNVHTSVPPPPTMPGWVEVGTYLWSTF